jgi:DNA end-binding protein Ku
VLDLAKHIVEQKSRHFEPEKFEDHYEQALQELLEKKQKGVPIVSRRKDSPNNVVNLMDALRASISGGKSPAKAVATRPAKKVVRPRRKVG